MLSPKPGQGPSFLAGLPLGGIHGKDHVMETVWFSILVGIIIAGLLVALGVFVDCAARLGEWWERK